MPFSVPVGHDVVIPVTGLGCGRAGLAATLGVPDGARGLVAFVHGSSSGRRSPRDSYVAEALRRAGLATLLFDLLTPEERVEDEATMQLRFDVELLAERVAQVVRWLERQPPLGALPVGLFGASTGAVAALAAALSLPGRVDAVVSRGGRPDLLGPELLRRIRAGVLLIVGGRDELVLSLNRSALPHLASAALAVVPGASHLFEEPGALTAVARVAAEWFQHHLRAQPELQPSG